MSKKLINKSLTLNDELMELLGQLAFSCEKYSIKCDVFADSTLYVDGYGKIPFDATAINDVIAKIEK